MIYNQSMTYWLPHSVTWHTLSIALFFLWWCIPPLLFLLKLVNFWTKNHKYRKTIINHKIFNKNVSFCIYNRTVYYTYITMLYMRVYTLYFIRLYLYWYLFMYYASQFLILLFLCHHHAVYESSHTMYYFYFAYAYNIVQQSPATRGPRNFFL